MLIIPAIDIRGGKVVRLKAGNFENETVYGNDPVDTAKRWESMGAKFLHVVDLDGAREGKPVNFEIVASIVESVSIPVETGGGIRDKSTIAKFIEIGTELVILGTKACTSPRFMEEVCSEFGQSIAVSIDSKKGKTAVEGWSSVIQKDPVELVREMEMLGAGNVIFTDVEKDGMMAGPNIKNIKKILEAVSVPITIAGGISSIGDIRLISRIKSPRLRGVIVGKALYEGTIRLKEAMEICNRSRFTV